MSVFPLHFSFPYDTVIFLSLSRRVFAKKRRRNISKLGIIKHLFGVTRTFMKTQLELTNKDMAQMLFNIATLLKDRQDNPYRVRAYERGARALMGRRDDAAAILRADGQTLHRRKGVLGQRVQRRLSELARTGRMEYFQELCADLPPHLGALMAAPGVGPRLAQRLHDSLGVETAEELAEAARLGRAAGVHGVGPKRAAQWGQLSLFE